MGNLRVLMVIRPDAESMLGGDTVQMQRTAAGLRELGVEVEESVGTPSDEALRSADVVHLFNLQTPEFTAPELRRAKSMRKPVALSTIYWDFGAEILLASSSKLQWVAKLLGRPRALDMARQRSDAAAAEAHRGLGDMLGTADLLLPNSEAEVEHLKRRQATLPTTCVIPNGIEAARFDPSRPGTRPDWAPDRYLLIVGRVERDKNQLPFCLALRGSGIPIVLAGPDRDPVARRACEALGARYVGPLAGDALVDAYRYADVHALPSFRETPGLVSLEAAAMGCRIVSTEVGSAREYFGDEAAYCDPNVPGSMRRAALAAWNAAPSPALSRRIRAEYDWSRAAKATLEAYRKIMR